MSNGKIEKILKMHSIDTMQRNGKIYALEYGTIHGYGYYTWVDLTGYNKQNLLAYLGY